VVKDEGGVAEEEEEDWDARLADMAGLQIAGIVFDV